MSSGQHREFRGAQEDAHNHTEVTSNELIALRSAMDEHMLYSMTDARGLIVDVNEGFCKISGYSREELIGQDHRILNSGHHPKAFWTKMWQTICAGRTWHGEVCNRAKDGSLYWVNSTNIPQFGPDGKICRFISLRFDITESKNTQAELERTKQLLEGTGRLARIGGWEVDLATMTPLWSDEVCRIHEVEPGYVPDLTTAINFYAPEYREMVTRHVERGIQHGEPWDFEAELITAKGRRIWVRAQGAAVFNEAGECKLLRGAFQEITDRVQARLNHEELQQRFERAIGGTSEGLWDYVPATGEVWYADQFKSLIGLQPDEYHTFEPTFASFANLLHPDDQSATLEAVRAHLEDDVPYDVEYRLRMTDGGYRWFRARGRASRDANGVVQRMSGSICDIHEHRTAETRLSLAVEAANVGLWDWDTAAEQFYFSDTYYRMLGYEPGEFTIGNDSWNDVCHPEDLEGERRDLKRMLEGGAHNYVNEHRIKKKDGSWLWVRDVGRVVERDECGAPRRVIGAHIDIDATKRRDHALRSALAVRSFGSAKQTFEQLCRAVTDVLGVQYACVARRTNVEDVDSASILGAWDGDGPGTTFTYHLAGTPCENALKNQLCVIHADVIDAYPEDVILAQMGAQSYAGISLFDSAGKPIGLLVTVDTKPLPSGLDVETSLRLFGSRAASELERLDREADLRTALQSAQAASVAKTEFLANMSHEIRTPMTAILGYADLLGADLLDNPEDAADAVRTIQSNASHLLTIINDILDVSKIEAEQMTVESIDTNPVQIVEEIASLIRPRAQGKGVDVRVRYDSPIPTVIQSDPTRVRQILLNLVGNAIKFTEMGSVTIRMSCDVEARSLRLCVVDTGIGMSREQRLSIARFEAFNQADASMTRKFGGSGLGLRISNALAKMLGGGIEIESIEGQGSTFIVSIGTGDLTGTTMLNPESTLTIGTESGGTDSCKRTNDSLGRPLEGLAILLAEDGPDNQRLISFHLKRAGADVTVCDNGAIAVTTINEASCSKRPHVVLMDMQMPELDGYGATRRLRQDGHTMPIIALTAHAMEGDRQKCLEAGCDDYLSKPIDRDELIAVCARHGCKAPLTTVLAGSPGNPSGRA